jgi:hypothetical protein
MHAVHARFALAYPHPSLDGKGTCGSVPQYWALRVELVEPNDRRLVPSVSGGLGRVGISNRCYDVLLHLCR